MSISTRKIFLPAAISLALLLTLALPAAAETRAIKGKVTDEKGQPVADAQITIMGTDIVRNLTAKTNKKGEYLYMLGLQVGTYRVIVRKAGYQPQSKANVSPQLGEEIDVDFTLVPGEDHKLPFEMTNEERNSINKQNQQQNEQMEKRKQFSAEIKAYFENGVKLSDQGMYAEAIEEFNKALEKVPGQSAIIVRIADAYLKLGKNEEAIANYKKAIELDPNNPSLYTNMGVALSKMGKTAESQEAFKKAAALNPAAAAQNFYNLGVTMVNSGKTEEAAEAFKQSIAADPSFAESYYPLGMALSGKQETIPAAIEALKKYVEIGKKPDQVEIAKQIIAALGGK
jgi:tetratricopeptide (TPR) repeat protein